MNVLIDTYMIPRWTRYCLKVPLPPIYVVKVDQDGLENDYIVDIHFWKKQLMHEAIDKDKYMGLIKKTSHLWPDTPSRRYFSKYGGMFHECFSRHVRDDSKVEPISVWKVPLPPFMW